MSTTGGFTPAGDPPCYNPRMTNAAAIALAAGAGLRENCVVVITDGPVIGNAITGTSATEIELNPVSPTAFGSTARVFTAFDTEAWAGEYDVATNLLVRLTDNQGNTAQDIDTAAGSPTVQTVFPWGEDNWRDNYMEDWVAVTPVVGQINPVSNSRFVNGNNLDLTGWAPALFNTIFNCEFVQTGVIHPQGTSNWTNTKVTGGTVNCAGGARINLSNSVLTSATIVNNATVDATAAHQISITRSLVSLGTITQNSDVGGQISVTDSDMRGGSLTIAAAAFKGISIQTSELDSAVLVGSGGTVLRTLSVSQSEIIGGVAINLIGDKPASITRSKVTMSIAWNIDGANVSAGLIILDSTLQGVRIDSGPASIRFDIARAVLSGGAIFQNGSGDMNISSTQGSNFLIDQQAGSTGHLGLVGSLFKGGGTITMLPACTRGSDFLACTFTQFSTADLSGTGVNAPLTDRFDQMDLVSGHFVFSAAAGTAIAVVARCRLLGGSEAGSGTLTVSGATVGVRVDQCEVEGVVTINNELGLTNPISFSGNKVGQGSVILVQGGDAAVRQIQNNVVNGRSTLTCTNLTGTAGAGLGDVFACNIDGQSAMTVTGARVAGQPVRNVEAINGASVNVDPNGTLLQCSFRNGAQFTSGAFRHSESVVEGAITKTALAANVNRLANKSFDDWI